MPIALRIEISEPSAGLNPIHHHLTLERNNKEEVQLTEGSGQVKNEAPAEHLYKTHRSVYMRSIQRKNWTPQVSFPVRSARRARPEIGTRRGRDGYSIRERDVRR